MFSESSPQSWHGQGLYESTLLPAIYTTERTRSLDGSYLISASKGPGNADQNRNLPACPFHSWLCGVSTLEREGPFGGCPDCYGLELGEITAFAVSDVFDFETGLRIVAERGRLMQEACDSSDGSIAAVIGVDRETVAKFCQEHDVEMANLNCPGQIVISGESAKIAAAVEDGKAKGFRRVMPLNVAGAYHSRLMQPAVEPFGSFYPESRSTSPYKVLSTTTGEAIHSPEAIRESIPKNSGFPCLLGGLHGCGCQRWSRQVLRARREWDS